MEANTRPVRMSKMEKLGHTALIVVTLGLWYPFYRSFNGRFKGRTVTY
jgi:hypothetical protein